MIGNSYRSSCHAVYFTNRSASAGAIDLLWLIRLGGLPYTLVPLVRSADSEDLSPPRTLISNCSKVTPTVLRTVPGYFRCQELKPDPLPLCTLRYSLSRHCLHPYPVFVQLLPHLSFARTSPSRSNGATRKYCRTAAVLTATRGGRGRRASS